MLVFLSINAGKLLPYQEYLLYKQSSSAVTKAYFQQLSSINVDGSERNDFLNAAEHLNTVGPEESQILPTNEVLTDSVDDMQLDRGLPSPNASNIEPAEVSTMSGEDLTVVVGDDDDAIKRSDLALSVASADAVSRTSRAPSTDCELMSAENRKRVSEFFSHSRLHHISTWGAEYKAYVTQLQNQVRQSIFSVFDCFVQLGCFFNR